MEYLDIRGLRPFATSNLIKDVLVEKGTNDELWRVSFKLKNGKTFGLVTAIKEEKTYVKLETLIYEVEKLLGVKIHKIKLI